MFKKIVKESFVIYWSKISTLLTLTLVAYFPVNLIINWYIARGTGTLNQIRVASNLSALLYPLTVGVVTYLAFCHKNDITITPFAAIKFGLDKYFHVFKVNIIAGIQILGGIILLIVPGAFLATKYSLINAIAIVDPALPELPRKKSYQLTKGHEWEIFFTGLLFLGTTLMLSILASFAPELKDRFTDIILKSILDSICDLFGCITSVAMFLYYHYLTKAYEENAQFPDSFKSADNGKRL